MKHTWADQGLEPGDLVWSDFQSSDDHSLYWLVLSVGRGRGGPGGGDPGPGVVIAFVSPFHKHNSRFYDQGYVEFVPGTTSFSGYRIEKRGARNV